MVGGRCVRVLLLGKGKQVLRFAQDDKLNNDKYKFKMMTNINTEGRMRNGALGVRL